MKRQELYRRVCVCKVIGIVRLLTNTTTITNKVSALKLLGQHYRGYDHNKKGYGICMETIESINAPLPLIGLQPVGRYTKFVMQGQGDV